MEPARHDAVGAVQITLAREEDTFPDIARRLEDYPARVNRVENQPPDARWRGIDRGLGEAAIDASKPPGDTGWRD